MRFDDSEAEEISIQEVIQKASSTHTSAMLFCLRIKYTRYNRNQPTTGGPMSILSKKQNDLTVGENIIYTAVAAIVAFGATMLPFIGLGAWAKYKEKKNKID